MTATITRLVPRKTGPPESPKQVPPLQFPGLLERWMLYPFGVLHSHPHEVWALRMGTQVRERESGFRYTPTTTFETFPFPRATAEQREAIAAAARTLHEHREAWLNPPDLAGKALLERTLTNLYNARPSWLADDHARLDRAVLDAYGWPPDLPDDAGLVACLVVASGGA